MAFFLPPSFCLPFVPCTIQAHDLKTPLHSIMGEADFLRQTVARACTEIVATASTESPVALISELTLRLSSETEGLFDNVISMIQLLTMSINRTQDFIKISSDVALVPELGSFVLEDVLEMVDKCMASQNCNRIVNTHPLVRTASRLFMHTCDA
jgi:signal transduction histidine kinase